MIVSIWRCAEVMVIETHILGFEGIVTQRSFEIEILVELGNVRLQRAVK